jgi:hypothetical protein
VREIFRKGRDLQSQQEPCSSGTRQGQSIIGLAAVISNNPEFGHRDTYIDKDETLEVLCRVLNQLLSVWTEDAGVAVVLVWVLTSSAWWGVELDTLGGNGLERSEGESAGLNCVSWGDDLYLLSAMK